MSDKLSTIRLGIDIGSTTIKLVALDAKNKLLFSRYERHLSIIKEKLLNLLKEAKETLGDPMVSCRITGSGGVAISEILEVDFSGGYLRKAAGSDDISGDYNEYSVAEAKTPAGKAVTLKGSGGKIMLALWAENGYTYCVGITDGLGEADMLALADAVK